MLHLILGSAGSGKSHYLREKIAALAADTDRKILLIVPEQFSFESEREMYTLLGAELSRRVTVLSFTRLADTIFKTYGGMAGKTADNTKKLVFMELAVSELGDSLSYYKKAARYKSFAEKMLNAAEELKNAGISPEQLLQTALQTGDEALCEKVRELSALCDAYQAILEKSCVDPSDKLQRAAERVADKPFFKDSILFFDEFKSFTGGQMPLIRQMIRDAADCYVALCTDDSRDPIYTVPDDTAMRLKRIAREVGVQVSAPVLLKGGKRFTTEALQSFANNCFSILPAPFSGQNDAVHFVTASTAADEVDYVLSTICTLIRESGYRYREIAVIPTDLTTYRPLLESGMRTYAIPYYTDSADSIRTSPLIRFVSSLLHLASGGMNIDTIFTLLKCGFAPFDAQALAEFENYCFLWDIRGGAFRNPFTANPNGFSETFGDKEREQLERFNAIRTYVLNALEKLHFAKTHTASQIGRALFETLTALTVPEQIEQLMQSEETDLLTAQKLSRVWEILLEILDALAVSAGDYPMKLARYVELFETACGTYEMGTLPQTLDAVTVGSMERIRMDAVRAVFILGANKGQFPATVHTSNTFSESERKVLDEAGLELSRPFEYLLAEQKFNAYKVLTMPTERLYVTAPKTDEKGDPLLTSELYKTAVEIFSPSVLLDVSELPPAYFCKTTRATFETYAKRCRKRDVQTASMRAALAELPAYCDRLPHIEQAANQSAARLTDSGCVNGIFPSRLNISPSGLERFYQCKFKFFCQNGLRVKPLTPAKLDPMRTGSILHDILESLASDAKFASYTEDGLKEQIRQLLTAYLERVMGGEADKSARFTYLYNRLRRTLLDIALHLQAEFRQSEFTPSDFELQIGADSEVKPLVLYTEDGTRVSVSGRIDRVDIAQKNGRKYVRVVDYKSGRKTFELTDIYYGLNLQMLVYLFCIWKKGEGKYADSLPAGVLYMPARAAENTRGRADSSTIEREKQKQYKMNGLLLNDLSALSAMEPELSGIFIPAKLKKDGTFDRYSTLADLSEMGKLYAYAEKLFTRMASELRGGDIAACPLEEIDGKRKTCEWCDYHAVCGVESDDPARRMIPFKEDEFYKVITEEAESDET